MVVVMQEGATLCDGAQSLYPAQFRVLMSHEWNA
jgi:hypothetical protein